MQKYLSGDQHVTLQHQKPKYHVRITQRENPKRKPNGRQLASIEAPKASRGPPGTALARPKHSSLQRMLFVSMCRAKRFVAEGRPSTKKLSSGLLKSVFRLHLCELCMCRETTPKGCQHPTGNTIRKVSVQLSAYMYVEINEHKKTG